MIEEKIISYPEWSDFLEPCNYILPEEILLSIFSDSNLDINDIHSISLTCKHWKILSKDEFIWKEIFNRTFHTTFHDSTQKYFDEYKLKYSPFTIEYIRIKKKDDWRSEPINHRLFFNINPDGKIGKKILSDLFKDSNALKIIECIKEEHFKGCIEECNQEYIQQVAILINNTFPAIFTQEFPRYLLNDEETPDYCPKLTKKNCILPHL